MFHVYVLRSEVLRRFYCGFSKYHWKRQRQHRAKNAHWTGAADDWQEAFHCAVETRAEARALEKRIKARGAKRFLDDQARRCEDPSP